MESVSITAELKQAMVTMMMKKDEIEDRNGWVLLFVCF